VTDLGPTEPEPERVDAAQSIADRDLAHSRRLVTRKGAFAWMARNPVAANLAMAVLFIGGILAIPRVRQEVFPEFDLDLVLVQVPYPGASPAEVEQGIALVVEEAVRGIDGVKEVRSTSVEGMAVVAVELMLGADARKAYSDVEAAVGRIASFPEDAERPVVSLATLRSETIGLVLYGAVEEASLHATAERIRDDLLQDPRITTVDFMGVRPLEIHVEAPEERLREYNMSLDEIARAVRTASVDLPAGAVKTRRGEVLLRTSERRRTGQEIGEIVLRSRPDGTVVRVRDVATIRDGYGEVEQEARYDGQRAVMLTVLRVGEQKPLEIAEAVKAYALAHAQDLPPGIRFAVWNDRSEIFADRLDLLTRNALQSLILVLITLALFLDPKLSFWVALGIPTSFAGALLFMPMFGVSINMISLFAFILTTGIVVDDAIVVTEAVATHRDRGLGYLDAAIAGVREVGMPVVFSVLTTVVAFVPLLFVPGVMGKFFWNIPVVVITVLLISLVESLFVLPAHLGHSRPIEPRGPLRPLMWARDKFGAGLAWFVRRVYAPVQRRAIERRYLSLAIGVAALIATFGLVAGGRIEQTFFPRIDSDLVRAKLTMPVGTSIEDTRAIQNRLIAAGMSLTDEMAGGTKVRRGTFSTLGMMGAGGGGPGGSSRSTGTHLAEVAFFFVPSDQRPFTAREFAQRWRSTVGDVSGVDTLEFDFSTGGPGGKPIDFVLSHADVHVLERAAADLAGRLSVFSGLADIDDGFAPGKEQLDVHLRPEARSLGITESDLARQLRSAFFGAEAVREQRGRNEVRVYVRRPREERESLASVEQFLLRTPEGGEIPLVEAADVTRGRAYTSIARIDGRRTVHVTADVRDGTNETVVAEEVKQTLLPALMDDYPGLGWSLGGQQQSRAESTAALGSGFLLALVAMFALMAIPFKSYVQPLIVMTAIPFSFIGAIIGHLIVGYDLSLMSMMGMVALAGVAVNDAIVLVDAINELRKMGVPLHDAVNQAGSRRFRPIMLTSLTTFFGLMPLILEPSVQARFLIPMAVSLGFGVMFCTFTTLLLVPAFYTIVEDMKSGWLRARDFLMGPPVPVPGSETADAADAEE
jgi:multidrug efflux pump subunit AcrB